jgi:enoyl-CoA hydratase/carnithine racemase
MSDEVVTYDTDEQVGVITLNRAAKLNAFDAEMLSVGMDIELNYPTDATERHDPLRWHESLRGIVGTLVTPWHMKKPVIAQVHGYALGAACELAMLCDLTIASDDAKFGEPEIRLSVFGPAVVMPWFIGLKKARELLLFGDTIDAETALQLGMINRIVPAIDLETETLKYARRLSLVSPEALRSAKLSINRAVDSGGLRNGVQAGVDILAPLYAGRVEGGVEFRQHVEMDGLRPALKWRNSQFDN